MLGPVIRVLVLALVVLAAISIMTVGLLQDEPRRPELATLLPEARPLPDFTLTSHRGARVGREAFAGRYSLVFFGFTHCPDVCPLTLQMLADVRASLVSKDLEPPEIVFVSVDPDRDDQDQVAAYVGYFDTKMTGVFGPTQALKPLLDFFGVAVHRTAGSDGEAYTVTHSSAVFMVGPAAQYVAVFGSPRIAAEVERDYLTIRRLIERT